jgi:hypothetical protein
MISTGRTISRLNRQHSASLLGVHAESSKEELNEYNRRRDEVPIRGSCLTDIGSRNQLSRDS